MLILPKCRDSGNKHFLKKNISCKEASNWCNISVKVLSPQNRCVLLIFQHFSRKNTLAWVFSKCNFSINFFVTENEIVEYFGCNTFASCLQHRLGFQWRASSRLGHSCSGVWIHTSSVWIYISRVWIYISQGFGYTSQVIIYMYLKGLDIYLRCLYIYISGYIYTSGIWIYISSVWIYISSVWILNSSFWIYISLSSVWIYI